MKNKLKVKLARIKKNNILDTLSIFKKKDNKLPIKLENIKEQRLLESIRIYSNKNLNEKIDLTKTEVNKYRQIKSTFAKDIYENEISYIEDAPRYIQMLKNFGSSSSLSREVFSKARVTFETMQLNTLDDYFLFFASANLLNSCAKRLDTGYEFKTRLEQAINAISQEHASTHKGYNVIKDCVSFYSQKDCNMDCLYVTINGVQFSFHRAVGSFINNYPGAKQQKWAGIRLQKIATDIWEYANRLDNLSKMSLVCDDNFKPISLKHLQSIAFLNSHNPNSPYYEKYKDNEDIFEIPTCEFAKKKYLDNLFSKLRKDCELKGILKNTRFIKAVEDENISLIHQALRTVYSTQKTYIKEENVKNTEEKMILQKLKTNEVIPQDYLEDIDPRDLEYYDDAGKIRTLASVLE